MYERYRLYHRITHGLMILAFFGNVLTGLPLSYPEKEWAKLLFTGLGGRDLTPLLHRGFALLICIYSLMHIGFIFYTGVIKNDRGIFFGPGSMVPRGKDFSDFWVDLKWFLGQGERAKYDRFIYWQKFYYWAEFFGVLIMCSTGFILWFPVFFSKFLPNSLLTTALILHAKEALTAMTVIFVFHFFHMHFRPEKFPADKVIFTGRITEEEFLEEHPLEYSRLKEAGALESIEKGENPRWLLFFATYFWILPIGVGFAMIILVILSETGKI